MNNLVLRENSGGAAILTLNRPEKLNALSKDVFEALEKHVDAIARETRTIGLVILRGAGGNFSAGYDMQEVLEHVKAHAKPHFHSEVIQKARESAAAGDLRRSGPLLDRAPWSLRWRRTSSSPPSRRNSPTSTRAGV